MALNYLPVDYSVHVTTARVIMIFRFKLETCTTPTLSFFHVASVAETKRGLSLP